MKAKKDKKPLATDVGKCSMVRWQSIEIVRSESPSFFCGAIFCYEFFHSCFIQTHDTPVQEGLFAAEQDAWLLRFLFPPRKKEIA